MDAVKGTEKLSGLASVTPEFIKSWSVSACKGYKFCSRAVTSSIID